MTNKWFIVGGIAALAFILGRHSKNVPVQAVAEVQQTGTNELSTVTTANGQPYLNLGFSFENVSPADLSREYVPLFGFVGTRSIF